MCDHPLPADHLKTWRGGQTTDSLPQEEMLTRRAKGTPGPAGSVLRFINDGYQMTSIRELNSGSGEGRGPRVQQPPGEQSRNL
jgi:hypothetical protein